MTDKRYVINKSNMVGRNDYFEIEVDPPLVFVNNDVGEGPKTVTGRLCAVCVCEMGNGLTRVVIHKAERLAGGEGLAYGGGPSRIMDGFTTMNLALEYMGYAMVDSLEVPDTETKLGPKTFEVWPKGGNSWILTHDEVLAESVYDECGPGNVIAYQRVEYVRPKDEPETEVSE